MVRSTPRGQSSCGLADPLLCRGASLTTQADRTCSARQAGRSPSRAAAGRHWSRSWRGPGPGPSEPKTSRRTNAGPWICATGCQCSCAPPAYSGSAEPTLPSIGKSTSRRCARLANGRDAAGACGSAPALMLARVRPHSECYGGGPAGKRRLLNLSVRCVSRSPTAIVSRAIAASASSCG
jgi:hypothetical protein